MKKAISILIMCNVFCILSFSQNYFYTSGKKNTLFESKYYSAFVDTKKREYEISSEIELYKLKNNIRILKAKNTITLEEYKKNQFPDSVYYFKTFLLDSNDINSVAILTDEFLVSFKNGVDDKIIDKINKENHVTILRKNRLFYTLKVSKGDDALMISNLYYNSGLVIFSHPNFITKTIPTSVPNDTYFPYQFYLNNTGQTLPNENHIGTVDADIDAPEAWEITKGDPNIIVAIVDWGVTSDHPDLPNSRQIRLPGSNFSDLEGEDLDDPSPSLIFEEEFSHGNGCAGIVGATQNNNEGISGIAPHCMIMPVKISWFTTYEHMALSVCFAADNGADIISCSWTTGASDAMFYAIQDALTYGRENLGCIMTFAAGNTANHANNSNGYIVYPAYLNLSGMLCVGASDRTDHQANYSPNGSIEIPIDVVAPSHKSYPWQIANESYEVWTMDTPDDLGLNTFNINLDGYTPPAQNEMLPSSGTNHLSYTGRFGGTSAATPMVAGVAALLLSVKPGSTVQQVYNYITQSANKVGGYTYTNGWSVELGYGRVNAYDAITAACPWSDLSNMTIQSNNTYTGCMIKTQNTVITNNSTVVFDCNYVIDIPDNFEVTLGSSLEAK